MFEEMGLYDCTSLDYYYMEWTHAQHACSVLYVWFINLLFIVGAQRFQLFDYSTMPHEVCLIIQRLLRVVQSTDSSVGRSPVTKLHHCRVVNWDVNGSCNQNSQ